MKLRPWNAELIEKLKTLEYLLSSFRKRKTSQTHFLTNSIFKIFSFFILVLRFGKCIDTLHSAQRTVHHTNVILRLTLTLGKIAQALFLYADHLVWLSRTGLTKSIDANKWNKTANKYWFISIVMNLCRDFYELTNLIDRNSDTIGATINRWLFNTNINNVSITKQHLTRTSLQAYSYLYENQALFIDITKNLCDLFIPLTALGYTKLNPRTVGCLGVLSSMAAIFVLIRPRSKLQP